VSGFDSVTEEQATSEDWRDKDNTGWVYHEHTSTETYRNKVHQNRENTTNNLKIGHP